uniref:Uncharacterized protein n=1 Tax=Lithotoma petraea TaxID=1929855 RepID=A0A1L6BSB6_9ASTR|nr:hypothetical protein Li_pet1Pt0116 [Lithotoma petraea]APQ38899.1 hypothetical protein Li_pet1Pt0116 [Lithotoma petraea]
MDNKEKKCYCLHQSSNSCIYPKKKYKKETETDKNQSQTYSNIGCPNGSVKKTKINGKKFPKFERESLFPQLTEQERKFLSFGKKHQPALTCPHHQNCPGYKHSHNTDYCATYSKETCKLFWEAFHSGHGAGERWMNGRSPNLWEAKIKAELEMAAKNPKTERDVWYLGFFHGAFLCLKRLKRRPPKDC